MGGGGRERGRSSREPGTRSVVSQEESAAGQWTVSATDHNGPLLRTHRDTRYGCRRAESQVPALKKTKTMKKILMNK